MYRINKNNIFVYMNLYEFKYIYIRCEKSIKFVIVLHLYLSDRISFLLNCDSFCVKNAR